MSEEKISRLLGLASRAGKLTPGLDATLQGLERGEVKLVVLAQDAGRSTRRKITIRAAQVECPLLELADSEKLTLWTGGHKWRAVLGVTDEGFSDGIAQAFAEGASASERGAVNGAGEAGFAPSGS